MSTSIKRMIQDTVGNAGVAYRRYRTCDRKKVYRDMEAGWQAVQSIQRNGNDPFPDFELRPYTCAYCHRIHVGHSNTPKTSEARIRARIAALAAV